MTYEKNLENILNELCKVGDKLADEVVNEVFLSGKLENFNSIFLQDRDFDKLSDIDIPLNVKNYLVESSKLPNWADIAKINKAQETLSKYKPQIITILLFSSLPALYADRSNARILRLTSGTNFKTSHNFLGMLIGPFSLFLFMPFFSYCFKGIF